MSDKRRDAEAGIALVLALLSLMLLTFLGLGLAATTSTELQIANNYRWSQQAFYNAEAGLEIAKKALAGVDWNDALPKVRMNGTVPLTWYGFSGDKGDGDTLTPAGSIPAESRDYESYSCDWRGHGMGYGLVLEDDNYTYANISSGPALYSQTLRGAFTIWVRRPVVMERVGGSFTGLYHDSDDNGSIVITVEGVAPYGGAAAGTAVAQQYQAVRMIEAAALSESVADACESQSGQTGGSEGANFAKCFALNAGSIRSALGMTGEGALGQSNVR